MTAPQVGHDRGMGAACVCTGRDALVMLMGIGRRGSAQYVANRGVSCYPAWAVHWKGVTTKRGPGSGNILTK